MYRRAYLAAGCWLALGPATGCIEVDPQVRERFLGFRRIEYEARPESRHALTVTPRASLVGDDDWAQFRNVSLVGLTESEDVACERELGTVRESGELAPVEMVCTGFPRTITYLADESPCDEDTEISRAVYEGRREGEHTWSAEAKRCRTDSREYDRRKPAASDHSRSVSRTNSPWFGSEQ